MNSLLVAATIQILSNIGTDKVRVPASELVCGVPPKVLYDFRGPPDKMLKCAEYRSVVYGDTVYFFYENLYAGEVEMPNYFERCLDSRLVRGFKKCQH